MSQVQSKRSGDTYRNYANGFIYNAAGAVTAMKLGNGKWENTIFNSRLQPTQIGLGNGVASQNLLKLEYSYGTTANNGNVVSQTITVPGVTHPFVQSYTYDELNRVSVAEETQNSSQTWKQTFTYDRYGNRNFVTTSGATTTLPGSFDPDIYNPTISTTNNRFSSGQGYSYDNSGNTTADAENRTFVYDAENKQISVSDGSGTIGQYFYDGDGKRVKKIVPATGETTVFVYDAAGKQIAEYSTVVQTGSNAKINYTTNDSLGSPRINTDGIGSVISRHDYHPFGEEIARSGYGSDTIRKQFTGYERDNESSLDFAQARMFAYDHGRFTSPDPYKIVAEVQYEQDPEKAKAMLVRYLTQPQQWNQYPYAINNPLKYTDPTGEIIELTGTEEEQKAALARLRAMLGDERFALLRQSTVNGNIQLTIDSSNINKFAAIGDDNDNKEFSAGMASILADSRIAEFRIAEQFQYKDSNGKTQTGYTGTGCFISACGNGGITLRPSENASGNGNYQIFVHPDAGQKATTAAAGVWSISSTGKDSLVSSNDMVDAHEFGHVSEIWRPRFQAAPKPGMRPKPDSIVFENAVRSRYPSTVRRAKH